MKIQASAPGKLLLLGEYAVLYGAPALVTAVDRRARVTLTPSEDAHWRFSSPQLQLEDYRLEKDGATPATAPSATRQALSLFTAVMQTVDTHGGLPAAQSVVIDSGDFFHGRHKLGIGSSAAVAVALTGALTAALDSNLSKGELFNLAAQAHRQFQGGIGSNADIAAAVYGGTLVHHIEQTPEPVALPPSLQIVPIFTGKDASTPALVGKVEDLHKRSPQQFARHIQAMTDITQGGLQALRADDAGRFVNAASDYYLAMEALGKAAEVEIISDAHQSLRQIAADCGVGYKPSGAGGGDIGCIFQLDRHAQKMVIAALNESGFTPLALTLEAPGLRVM